MRRVQWASVPAPAATTDISWVPSTTDEIKILAITATLVTSSTVANRNPSLVIKDREGNIMLDQPMYTAIAASLTTRVGWHAVDHGMAQNDVRIGSALVAPMSELWLPPGFQVATSTANLASGDQWGPIWALYEQRDNAAIERDLIIEALTQGL